jgi:signal transduction histidine kinase
MSLKKVGFFGSIRGRLILANLALVLVLLALSVVSSQQFAALGRTIGVTSNGAELLLRLGHVADEREAVTAALAAGYSDGEDQGARAKLEALLTDFAEHLTAAVALSESPPEKAEISQALKNIQAVSGKLAGFNKLAEDARTEVATEADDQLGDALTAVQKAKLLARRNMEARLLEVRQALDRPILLLWTATAIGCVLALFLALFTNRRVARPIAQLMSGVESLADGRVDEIRVSSQDELGLLGQAFNGMAATITERSRSLKLVLDNVGDALLTVGRAGQLVGEPSRHAIHWFGEPTPGASLWSYLAPEDGAKRLALQVGFEQLCEEFLPFEAAAEQMPGEVVRGTRIYALQFREVRVNDQLDRVLVVATDVTDQRIARINQRKAQDRFSLASLGMRDPDAYIDFCRDTEQRLARALRGESVLLHLHTVKGNAGVLGCEAFAERVHEAETRLSEGADCNEVVPRVQSDWQALHNEAELTLGRTANEVIMVRRDQYDRLLRLTADPRRAQDAHALARSWSMHQVGSLLSRLTTAAERYAVRQGKAVTVSHAGGDLALARGRLDELWACLSHLVRNAVSHGLESETERLEHGKPAAGQITVSASVASGTFRVQVKDDGKGIDWDALSEKTGLPKSEGIKLLMAGSNAADVSEISGRGVGVAAVNEVVQSLGGQLEVESELGHGSLFRVVVPLERDAAYCARSSQPPPPPDASV